MHSHPHETIAHGSFAFELTPKMLSMDKVVAARAYTKSGLRVLLTHGIKASGGCTCGARNCRNPGKHPIAKYFPNGVKNATSDFEKVKRALGDFPEANIAMSLDNVTVVDVDGPEGKKAVAELDLPETVCVKSHRGKHHIFIGTPSLGGFKASEVDVLCGSNKYSMLPPSRHASGENYRWLKALSWSATSLPSSIELLRTHPKIVSIENPKIALGRRNDTLFKLAASLRRKGFDDETIFAMIAIANERRCTQPLSKDEVKALVTSSGRYNDSEPLFGLPSERTPLPMEFLWYPYIPRFGVTIIAGDPGKGKSLLLAHLVATVTQSLAWPLSHDRPSGQRVLLLSAEDNWARVTLARLAKAGANIDNIHVMHKYRALTDERMAQLNSEIMTWKPDLVVIDTLSAYMGAERDMHRQNDVGEFLAELTEMAEEAGCAIVVVGHLNKQSIEHPLYRIVGSIGFAASVRSALFLGSDPDRPDDGNRLALAHGKANATPKGKTMIFERIGGGRDDVPVLRALEFSDANEHDVCRLPKGSVGRPVTASKMAEDFILSFLEEGPPASWTSVLRAAEVQSIASQGTLNLVRAEMAKAALIRQIGKGRKAKWTIGRTPPVGKSI